MIKLQSSALPAGKKTIVTNDRQSLSIDARPGHSKTLQTL
mgnify:FL=1